MDAFSVGAGAGTAGADRTGPSARAPAAAREAGFRHHLARQEGMCAVDAGIDDHHSLAKPAIACGPREVALDLRHRLRQRRHVRPILRQGEDGGIGGEGVDLVRRGFNRHEGQLLEAVPGLQEGVRQPCLQGRPDTGDVVPLLHRTRAGWLPPRMAPGARRAAARCRSPRPLLSVGSAPVQPKGWRSAWRRPLAWQATCAVPLKPQLRLPAGGAP